MFLCSVGVYQEIKRACMTPFPDRVNEGNILIFSVTSDVNL